MLWMMRREAKRRRNEKAIKMRCISVKGMHRFLLYENQIPQGTTLVSFRKISADFCGTHSAPLRGLCVVVHIVGTSLAHRLLSGAPTN